MTDTSTNSSQGSPKPPSDRQSQMATLLIGLLIVASGLLIYNYFQSSTAPETTTFNQDKPRPTVSPTPNPVLTTTHEQQGSYTVVAGDSLWAIAEKVYGDGYQWPKIVAANDLPLDAAGQPAVDIGQQLVVPDSAAMTSQNVATQTQLPDTAIRIYTVQSGDSLWSIAVQIYGDGRLWSNIATDPHNHLGQLPTGQPLIHAGNQLYIPPATS